MKAFTVEGNIVDIFRKEIYYGTVTVAEGKIHSVSRLPTPNGQPSTISHQLSTSGCILPGFTDSHVHIESSMLIPSEFGKLAVLHGTVATISDPHEIANVCGMEGVQFMIENGKNGTV